MGPSTNGPPPCRWPLRRSPGAARSCSGPSSRSTTSRETPSRRSAPRRRARRSCRSTGTR
eukprot:3814170-Prymnesium_polylepis.1